MYTRPSLLALTLLPLLLCASSWALAAPVVPVYIVGNAAQVAQASSASDASTPAQSTTGAIPVFVVGSSADLAAAAPVTTAPVTTTVITHSSGYVDEGNHTYRVAISAPHTADFSTDISLDALSPSAPFAITKDHGYIKSMSCCELNTKTGKKDLTIATAGTYRTGLSINLTMMNQDPSLIRVAIDLRSDLGRRPVADGNSTGMSVELPSVQVATINQVVRLNDKGHAAFKMGDKTVTLDAL